MCEEKKFVAREKYWAEDILVFGEQTSRSMGRELQDYTTNS